MIPLLSIALTLISNVTDLAHMFVSDKLDDRPALSFYFENRHEEASFAFFDEHGDAQTDVLKDFSHFVRCWRTGREKAMHPRTIISEYRRSSGAVIGPAIPGGTVIATVLPCRPTLSSR